jgi:hypothetical protein
MLVSFHGHRHFKQFMPNKPAKYGIKVVCLADARNSYFHNEHIYVGMGWDGTNHSTDEQCLAKPAQSMIHLSQHLQETDCNIMADNWPSFM